MSEKLKNLKSGFKIDLCVSAAVPDMSFLSYESHKRSSYLEGERGRKGEREQLQTSELEIC